MKQRFLWETVDIDIFIRDQSGKIAFIATNGLEMPGFMENGINESEQIESYFLENDYLSEIWVNPDLHNYTRSTLDGGAMYLSAFSRLAKKGVYAFDAIKNTSDESFEAFLVAAPLNSLNANQILQKVLQKLPVAKNIVFKLSPEIVFFDSGKWIVSENEVPPHSC